MTKKYLDTPGMGPSTSHSGCDLAFLRVEVMSVGCRGERAALALRDTHSAETFPVDYYVRLYQSDVQLLNQTAPGLELPRAQRRTAYD